MRSARLLMVLAILSGALGLGWAAEPTVSFNGWVDTDPTTVQGTVTVRPIDTTTPRPSMGYVEYVPQGYDSNDHTKRWPVVFTLLGVGEEGDGKNTGNQLFTNMTKHGPLFDVVTLKYDFPCIIITPQAPSPSGWNNVTQLRAMVDYVKANYRVDTTRIFMTGLCDGAAGTLRFATTYPGILAGAIPITATYAPTTQDELNAVKNLPMWFAHCFADQEFNRRETVSWVNQVAQNNTGVPSDLLATYPGYGGTSNHYACLMTGGGLPTSPSGLGNTIGSVTVTNGSATVTMPSGNLVANSGSFFPTMWSGGSDAAPFATVTFSGDSSHTTYVVSSVNGSTMTLTHPYGGTSQTTNANVSTPVGLVETAYYQLGGTWTWPGPATTPNVPAEQDPPPAGVDDNLVFTMFWQSDHTAGWVNTWKNGKVWDWLFTRAPNTTPATVVLGGLSTTYTGAAQAVSVTTTPAGLAVDVTYGGVATLPINAGSYAVVATVNDPVYSGSANGTLTIAPAALGVALSNLSVTWDGGAKSAGVTTTPPDVAVAVAYSSGSVPVEPGSYTVAASSSDPNYAGSASGTLTIGKAAGSVAFGQLSFPFDGTAKPVSPTTTPAGLATSITYQSGSSAPTATPPSAAGTYTVVATIADAHYLGAASGTMTIAPNSATVTLSGLGATFDTHAHAVTATTNPAGLATVITYDGTSTVPTAAGAHAVVATVTDPNFVGSASGTLTIAPASATVTLDPASLTAVFDGSGHAATVTTSPAGLATTITYDGAAALPRSVAAHTVVATISDPNYTGSANGTLTISSGSATVTLSGLAVTYNGGQQAVVVTTSPAGLATTVAYTGASTPTTTTPPTTVGSYAVVATVNGPNYSGSASGTLTIAPAPVTITLAGLSATYDGNAHAAVVSTNPGNVATTATYNGDSAVPTDAGTYAVAVQVADPDFQGSPASGTLTIAQGAATVSFTDLTSTFDGQPHAVTVVTNPVGLATTLTYDGAATVPSAAGTHAVAATITDPNYVGSGSAVQTIATSPATITLSGLAATYDGTAKPVAATTVPAGLTVTLTYAGSATPPTEAGSYAVAGTVVDPDFQGTVSGTLVIARAVATVTLGGLTAVYDGTPKAASASGVPAGLAVTVTYDGAAQAPTAAGSYAVVAVVDTADYVGSASGTLVIAKAPLAVVGDDASGTVGAAIPVLGFHLVGLLASDDRTVLLGAPALSTTATSASPAGTYPVTVSLSGVHADNYALTAQPGSLVLTAASSGGGTTAGSGDGGSGGGGGCGHGTAFAALLVFSLMLMGYLRLMVARPDGRRD